MFGWFCLSDFQNNAPTSSPQAFQGPGVVKFSFLAMTNDALFHEQPPNAFILEELE